jgi:hypothetical protein
MTNPMLAPNNVNHTLRAGYRLGGDYVDRIEANLPDLPAFLSSHGASSRLNIAGDSYIGLKVTAIT